MATKLKFQLSNSVGINRIIVFEGLAEPVLVAPALHGEPLLTAQALHYVEQMESTAVIRFEGRGTLPEMSKLEYMIDNYLFEYSKFDDSSRLSMKLVEGKYWNDDGTALYQPYDEMNTMALVLDISNDPGVHSIQALPGEPEPEADFSDWCVVKNYSDHIFYEYVKAMAGLVNKKVIVQVMPNQYRDGHLGKMRLLECDDGLVDHYQALSLDSLTIRDIPEHASSFEMKSDLMGRSTFIRIDRVQCSSYYSPLLLSYYFSGLKELNPPLAFVGFYNVIEYYFEEAPALLFKAATTEALQLRCVVELLVSNSEIAGFISGFNADPLASRLSHDIETSSSINIRGFDTSNFSSLQLELARWLYEIRCAVIHSKKTRRGAPTPIFEPYSDKANNIKLALPFLKWLAIKCIDKDALLNPLPAIL